MTSQSARPRRIVVGVDSSDHAARAATWAAGEAAGRGASLHMVHALDLPPSLGPLLDGPEYDKAQRDSGQALLDHLADKLRHRTEEHTSELQSP